MQMVMRSRPGGPLYEARCDDGVGCDVTSIMLKASVLHPYAPWFSVVGVGLHTRRSDRGR